MRTTNRKSEANHHIPIDPHISRTKYDALVARLASLRKKKPELAKEVADLATLGDFSENFEYQQAKHELRRVNNQIIKLQHRIDTAIIIESTGGDVVEIGSTVIVNVNGEKKIYTILGSSEVDAQKGIISHTSPIGSALLGSSVGETILVHLPKGTVHYTIVSIS